MQYVIKYFLELTEDDDVFGANLYGFKTPKKSGQMMEKGIRLKLIVFCHVLQLF